MTIVGDAEQESGEVNLNFGTLNIDGNLSAKSGRILVNCGTLNISGDYIMQNISEDKKGETVYESCSATLIMEDEDDKANIKGNVVMHNVYPGMKLSNGTMTISGDIWTDGYFSCSKSNKVILNGTDTQNIYGCNFNTLEIQNPSSRKLCFTGKPKINTLTFTGKTLSLINEAENISISNITMDTDAIFTFDGTWNGISAPTALTYDTENILSISSNTVNAIGGGTTELTLSDNNGNSSMINITVEGEPLVIVTTETTTTEPPATTVETTTSLPPVTTQTVTTTETAVPVTTTVPAETTLDLTTVSSATTTEQTTTLPTTSSTTLPVTTTEFSTVTTARPETIKGDINNDGTVTVIDIVYIMKYLLLESGFNETLINSADMNNDGTVNIFDLIRIKRTVIG